MTQFKTIDDLDVSGKRVLIRVDLNVPMKDGHVTDSTRIDRAVPTLNELSRAGAKVVILSHFGRPKGQVNTDMSLWSVSQALANTLGRPVVFAEDCIGVAGKTAVAALGDGDIVLLENLRFHPEEEANDGNFADQLAALGDIYINDAFSCAHRAHASTEAIARRLPSAAGRLMQAELEALSKALVAPEHPVAALVGGAKISSKMEVLGHLVKQVDVMIIGGGMANTFLNAKGIDIGNSLCEHDMADAAREILKQAEIAGCEIMLPNDARVAREFKAGADCDTVKLDAVASDQMILDIGPDSVDALSAKLSECKTLLWNGPLGAFEIEPFDYGTNAVAQHAARLTKEGSLLSVAGGGDTVAALINAGTDKDFTYISTAGGAFLEWLEGKVLPGVKALEDNA